MNVLLRSTGALVLAGGVACAASHPAAAPARRAPTASRCAADSSYQRLAFWVGDWAVYDSTGKRYATQRVHAALDDCAITAEWTGPVGDKGLSISAFDVRAHEWRQVYVSNQVPGPSAVVLRRSDTTYTGPGIRFVPLLDPTPGEQARTRITIVPLSGHRVVQHFELSRDGGASWRTAFKAEHRAEGDGGR